MSYKVVIEGGESFEGNDNDSILSSALRASIGFPYDCASGGCGNCRFELVSGEVLDLWPEASGLSERDKRKNKKLACQCMPLSDVQLRVRTADEYKPGILPRRHSAVVERVRDLNHNMREVTLRTDGPANFQAGQFALLKMPRIVRARAYSMSNLPNQDGVWQFIIKNVTRGNFTSRVFDDDITGQSVELDGPYGMAWLRDNPRPILCIAGGSGFAPMLSICRGANERDPRHPIIFYYGANKATDLLPADLLPATGQGSSFDYRVALSEPDPAWAGGKGFIHDFVEKELGDRLREFEIYLAGPPAMVEAVQDMLFLRHQIPVEQVHLDRFF